MTFPPGRAKLVTIPNKIGSAVYPTIGMVVVASFSSVQLAPLINDVISTAGQLAEQNKIRLVVEAQENLGALTVDAMRLRQILLNLLSNACTTNNSKPMPR